ncbi:MAG TPA: hypothetical protein VFE24_07170 [Pirellulales bacterium]|nr:hypothetical protein [Pirellulales bacterium]
MHEQEKRWIAEEKNPEQEFDRIYIAEPESLDTSEPLGALRFYWHAYKLILASCLIFFWIQVLGVDGAAEIRARQKEQSNSAKRTDTAAADSPD